MQQTSTLYKQIVSNPLHSFETALLVGYDGDLITEHGDRILFGGVAINIGVSDVDDGYREDILFSVKTNQALFESNNPTVGGCVSAEIDIEMVKPRAEFKRMSELLPYVRAKDANNISEWLPKGVFYIDTRSVTHNLDGLDVLTLHGYDSMLKAEAFYPVPADQQIDWSTFEIGTETTKSTAASVEYTVASYPHLLDHFDELVGETLEYYAVADGMNNGSNHIGDLVFYNGDTQIVRVSVGGTFTVTSALLDATRIVIYGSTYGAHVYGYAFTNTVETISAMNMVNRIVSTLNEGIDHDIGVDDIRRLHLPDSEKYKLRHPDPSDQPQMNTVGDTDNGYRFNYIASAYTCREVLGMIASAYCGNWWIDDHNNLRLAILNEYPSETSRLIDQSGYQIMFGGEYIDVG